MTSERRQHIRIPGPFDAHRIDQPEKPLHIQNVSEGGCFISSIDELPKVGSSVALVATFPAGERLTLTGETVYAIPGSGFALLFTNLSTETQKSLERIVNQLRQRTASR